MRLALLAILLVLPSAALAYKSGSGQITDGLPGTVKEFVSTLPDISISKSEIEHALSDAGTNWQQLAAVLNGAVTNPPIDSATDLPNHAGYTLEEAAWLLVNAPHLDRLELTYTKLVGDLLLAGLNVRYWGSDPKSELWRRYILNYRFDDEPISEWRMKFYTSFSPDQVPTFADKWSPQEICEKAAADFTIIERGYFGNLSDPLSLLHSRAGSKRELSILVAAALRSQGYATRFVRENRSGESWVEVYSGDPQDYDARAWMPVYPTAPDKTGDVAYATELCGGRICVVTAGDAFGREQVTGRYMPLGYVEPQFTRGVTPDPDFSGWAISAWNEQTGAYVPLDDLEFPSSDKDYPLDESQTEADAGVFAMGPGEYRIEWGVRYPGGMTHVQSRDFSLQHAEQLKLSLSLDPPADLPQTALVERELGEFTDSPRLMHRGRYVFLVGDGGEPSLRAYELLKPLEARSSVFFQHWRMVGATDEDRAFVKDVLKVDLEKDSLPVVVVVVDGKATMYLRGYNLNVAQWVERALGGGNVE